MSFSRASSDCLCMASYTTAMTVIKGSTFHPTIYNV